MERKQGIIWGKLIPKNLTIFTRTEFSLKLMGVGNTHQSNCYSKLIPRTENNRISLISKR